MDSSNFAPPCRQLTPPFHQIPASCSTVDVRVIDTNTYLYLKPGAFYEPAIPSDGPRVPSYCFLLSHGDRHLVFDLGVRIDWQNYAPQIGRRISARQRHQWVDNRSSDIEAIVWSHNHFDHTGDPSRPDGTVLDSDAVGREIREINFDNTGLRIGRLAAFDYFGDGSFYLLDAPGHTAGHMCALARTTAYPPSFVFMGADACHHPGVLRPSQYLPLPRPLPGGGLRRMSRRSADAVGILEEPQ
ncbi:hypothetical protein COH20_012729 [Aspergillus flavus]|nr:hypothetical protein COH20_012729 [Aspergillus flavus]RAQ71682.1 hypothetical protein COH21_011983 [Aspergillus flavus]